MAESSAIASEEMIATNSPPSRDEIRQRLTLPKGFQSLICCTWVGECPPRQKAIFEADRALPSCKYAEKVVAEAFGVHHRHLMIWDNPTESDLWRHVFMDHNATAWAHYFDRTRGCHGHHAWPYISNLRDWCLMSDSGSLACAWKNLSEIDPEAARRCKDRPMVGSDFPVLSGYDCGQVWWCAPQDHAGRALARFSLVLRKPHSLNVDLLREAKA